VGVTAGEVVRIEVLGPIRVFDPAGQDLTPDGALQRRLLALLVLRRGRRVTLDAAIEVLWAGGAPLDPVAALHNQIFRLRRRLPEGLIESTGDGYRLDPSGVEVDSDRLSESVSVAGADPDADATVEATLARWHGPAYPELDDVDEGRAESIRLNDLRIRALEVRAECRLAAGESDRAIAELTALAEQEPLRERPLALLMTALGRAGRTADALRVYDDFRRLLGDELGIEPSPSLAAQHADLLSGSGMATAAPVSRLPVPVTTLIGRDALAAEAAAMVEAHRFVTLVGPGGVGKTRLLVEVGRRLRAARPDRPVVLCELAAATEGSAVDAVAAALAIEGRAGVGLAARVAAVLADTEIVVLLDNCEHVLGPVAALAETLLVTCEHVRLVATSRERVRVPAEHVLAVPTLPCDGEDSAAVRLFVERARAVASGFQPAAGERAAIGEIVRRLDGLPLAIELAAARLHTLDVDEIATGLDRRFELLSLGSRTSSRHGSLSAALSWSFDLLDERLQHTLADLSVFAGSFTMADAAAICGAELGPMRVALDQLTERSLAMRAPDHRYVLLETVRAYGAEHAAGTGRAERAGRRHAHHYADWIEHADRRLVVSEEPVFDEVEAALPELRAALDRLLDDGQIDSAGRLVTGLLDYGLLGLRPDVLAWSQRVIAADPEDRGAAAPVVLVAAAYAAWMVGDIGETGVLSRRALRASERRGGELPAEVATTNGNHALFEGRLDDATSWYRRAVDASVDDPAQGLVAKGTALLPLAYAGDPSALDAASALLADVGDARTPYAAYVWFCAGEVDLALGAGTPRARFARALEIAEQTHTRFVIGTAGASKASIDARVGDPLAAAEDYRRLLTHWRRAGVWSTQWTMLRSICVVLARLERWDDAAVLEGAIRATTSGHSIYGADEAALAELSDRLRAKLGDETYEARRRDGAVLDGDAAVEHALRAL
jgi:predicted ATPase/DNA-binding SARP family transcriptional activator